MSFNFKANASQEGLDYRPSDSSNGYGFYQAISKMSTCRAQGYLVIVARWSISDIIDDENYFESVRLNTLGDYKLKKQLDITIERDGTEYIARTLDLPLYALSASATEAIEDLKTQILSLYNELCEDDDYSPEWLKRKEFLKSIII